MKRKKLHPLQATPPLCVSGARRAHVFLLMMICLRTAFVLSAFLAATVAGQAAPASGANAVGPAEPPKDCQSILANNGDQQEALLCQLSESSMLLAQLGALVSEGVERLVQGHESDETGGDGGEMEKRKHEYLRFGKRKHEYLRFGKRKHEYLRFGKRKHEYLRFGRK
uniref:Uncharacterized protein n=2 Tax=Caenorhabditis japonica TaxID=281687 RepID=A0A8R1HZW3_CAEJA